MRFSTTAALLTALLAAPFAASSASAQTIFQDSFDSAANWTIRQTTDARATFGYDYSVMGIPASPNGGGTTTGLKLVANETQGAVNEISAVANGVNATGRYQVQFDFWINANGPFPGGGVGATQFIGGGVGLNGADAGRDGANLIVTGEGGAAQDWRLEKNKTNQTIASGQYNPSILSQDASDATLAAAFPGQSAPLFQQNNFPQQTGTLSNGTTGFKWHTMVITVDSQAVGTGGGTTPGLARFEVDGLYIGTVDNSRGTLQVDMTGGVGVMYADVFASISDNTALSFGVFDNFKVTQLAPVPGPGALLTGLMGAVPGACVLVRRRRRA